MLSNIAIIDDNKEHRTTLKRAIKVYLRKRESSLDVIDVYPFDDFSSYYSWIIDNNICALIFDEKMHNEKEDGKGPVGYKGSDLVIFIRKRFKDIPIFTVTSYANDEKLRAAFGEFEQIISRNDFSIRGDKFVDIIIRSSQRYLNENYRELAEYEELTKLVAIGKASANNIEKLRALQIKLNIPYVENGRNAWLEKYELQVQKLEELKALIISKIENK